MVNLRLAKFKRPRVLNNQKMSEDNEKWLSSFFCESIDTEIVILTNLSSYLSLTNKNSSMKTNTTYI